MEIEWRKRPTIMDGEVVTFSTAFVSREGIFGECFDVAGPFEISASRNAVVVHAAELKSDKAVDDFIEAVKAARAAARRLTHEGLGGNYAADGGSEHGK